MLQSSILISLVSVLFLASIATCRPIMDSSGITFHLLEITTSPLPAFDLFLDTSSSRQSQPQPQPQPQLDSGQPLDLTETQLTILDDLDLNLDLNLNPNSPSSFTLFPNPADNFQLTDSEEGQPETERLCRGENRFAFCCYLNPFRSGCVFTADCTREESLNCCTVVHPDSTEDYRDCQPVSSPAGGEGDLMNPLRIDDVSRIDDRLELFDGQDTSFAHFE